MAKSKKGLMVKSIAAVSKRTLFSLPHQKRVLSQQQEFEIMKLVLDKFLWLGFIVMLFGVFVLVRAIPTLFTRGLLLLGLGALVLVIFTVLLVKEYELFTH